MYDVKLESSVRQTISAIERDPPVLRTWCTMNNHGLIEVTICRIGHHDEETDYCCMQKVDDALTAADITYAQIQMKVVLLDGNHGECLMRRKVPHLLKDARRKRAAIPRYDG